MSASPAWQTIRDLFPMGRDLDAAAFRARHRAMLVILGLHVPAIVALSMYRGDEFGHSVSEALVVGGIGALAAVSRFPRTLQATLTALGLVAASSTLIHLGNGLTEMHFHFFVVLGLMTLYQSWAPYGIAFAFVIAYQWIMGTIDPEAVFNHPAAIANPIGWATIHGAFIGAAALVQLVSWRLAEREQARAEELRLLVHDAHLRRRQALQINDGIVQSLVVAGLARSAGDTDELRRSLDEALRSAKAIISDLVGESENPGGAVVPGDLVRDPVLGGAA